MYVLDKKIYEELKQSFYGWEYCVENGLTPEITHEDINYLLNLFIAYEDVLREVKSND